MEAQKGILFIVTGGTGGHLFPALSVAREARRAGYNTYLVIGGAKIKVKVKDIPVLKIEASELKPSGLLKIFKGFVNSLKLLFKYRGGKKVIATGSYASFPLLLAAIILRVPFYLLEQNVIPGRTIRYFSRFSRGVFTAFEETAKYLHGADIYYVGNPVRDEAVSTIERETAKEKLGFEPSKPLVFVLGGSLGAKRIVEAALHVAEELKDVQFMIQTGRFDLEVKNVENKRVKLVSFIDEIGIVYRAADLVVSRAGGGAIAEMMHNGRTGILIPYPYAKDDHQKANALSVSMRGGALMLEEKEIEKLTGYVKELLSNKEMRERMEKIMSKMAVKDTARRIIKVLEEK